MLTNEHVGKLDAKCEQRKICKYEIKYQKNDLKTEKEKLNKLKSIP